jgi:hypothetical protein
MTEPRSFDAPPEIVRRLERVLLWVDGIAGLLLTVGPLVFAIRWRLVQGGFRRVEAFYLHTSWCAGAALLLAAWAIHRKWQARWVLQLLPLVVPVIAAQWFLVRFIAPQLR